MVMGQQWLWPALVVAATMLGRCWATGCPSGCVCQRQHDQLIADCLALPTYGGEIVNLTISHTDPELELWDGSFNSFKHLKYLTLRNTSIYEVQNKTFYGANKIEKIDLAFNNITKLDATVFKDLNNLTSVSLRGNPIVLEQESPFLVSNSITHLDIGECQIDKIPEGVFYELKRLTHLTLDGNSIQSIEINVLPKGLQYLDLSNNAIKNVQTEVFSSLPNLKQLNLIGNPINCSCSLMKLIESYKPSNDITLEDGFNCTLSQKSKELCLIDTGKEYKQDENAQADQPVTDISKENDIAHQTMGNDKENNNENQDSTTVPSDSDENMSTSIATDSSMDVETTSDEPSNATSKTTTFSTRLKAADTNDIKLQNNVPETDTNDKITDSEKNSLKVTADDNSESGTQVTETTDHIGANTNTNDTDNQILSSSSTMTIEFDTKASQEDDFQQDDLILNVDIEKIQAEKNITSSKLITNEDVEGSGQGLDNHFDDDNGTQSLTSTTETNNSPFNTTSQEEEEIETESSVKDTENVSEPELKDNLTSNAITENEHPEATESPTPSKTSENEQLSPVVGTTEFTTYETPNNETETIQESIEKLQEMAGAQVVMFCVGILIICLVLFSIYKCRSSKNIQSMSNLKDIESNRGTELQDMASLLPKPEEKEEKKNNLKYEDKAPSSETVKLLSEPNENDSLNFTPVAETKTKLENKNSLNNNTPSSKEPLIKPEKPVTINPAAPIQRTKVKVGIIPDSIPRTPIFVQKTYNGTKNV